MNKEEKHPLAMCKEFLSRVDGVVELSGLVEKVVLKPRMYVRLSNDLKKSYSCCKGPGATNFSAHKKMAAARRAEVRGEEERARGCSTQELPGHGRRRQISFPFQPEATVWFYIRVACSGFHLEKTTLTAASD